MIRRLLPARSGSQADRRAALPTLHQAQGVSFDLGPPGVGKSHLSVGAGNGSAGPRLVRYATLDDLVRGLRKQMPLASCLPS